MSEIHVKGLADLQKFLDQLPAKLERNVMRGALRAGANIVKATAQANVHSISGNLAKSVKVSTRAKAGTVVARVIAGLGFGTKGMPPRNLPLWVEYGTAAHWIKVKESARPSRMTRRGRKVFSIGTLNKMATRGSLKIGSNFVGESVAHPGARPRAFMRPALDSQAQNAVVAAAEYVKKRLQTKHGIDTSGVTIEGAE